MKSTTYIYALIGALISLFIGLVAACRPDATIPYPASCFAFGLALMAISYSLRPRKTTR